MKLPRLADWLIVTAVLLALIAFFAPQQIGVTLYKLTLVAMGGWIGYWIDRSLFPYARPHACLVAEESDFCDGPVYTLPLTREQMMAFVATMLRRAIIIAACIIGLCLGA